MQVFFAFLEEKNCQTAAATIVYLPLLALLKDKAYEMRRPSSYYLADELHLKTVAVWKK